jgi:hypothetical protein
MCLLDAQIVNRPTIWEYEETIRKVYGITDEIGEQENGRSFMIDLSTKRQGLVDFEKVVEFGKKIRPRVGRYLNEIREAERKGAYAPHVAPRFRYEEGTGQSRMVGVTRKPGGSMKRTATLRPRPSTG